MELSEQLNKLGMYVVNTNLKNGAFALFFDGVLHLASGLFHHVLNAGGVNTSVGNKLFKGQSGNFAANRFEAGKGDCLGSVVDNKVDAGGGLYGTDVPSLAADYAAFHIIVGQRHHRNGSLGGMVGCTALYALG